MSRPLNVLRVITWLPVGGIEKKILAVLPRLNPERFRVRLVCLRKRGPLADQLEAAGIPVDLCPMPSRISPSGLRQLAALMRRHKIDIVHSHMYRSNIPATIAAHISGVPIMVTQVHNVGTWETMRQRWMDQFLCRWRTTMLAVSQSVQRDVMKNLRVPEEKIRVLYNGVDIPAFADASLREPTRKALGFGPRDLVIIYHGRLVPQKNPDALLKVAREVALNRPGVFLLIVGDGPERKRIELRASEIGVDGRIRFLGKRDDIPALLQASDLSILPSNKEGFSNAVLEAMAAGLPIVASDVGGNAEAVEHGRNGWIVPPGNDPALLNAVAQIIDHPADRRRMAAESARLAQRFSLDRMISEVESLYTSLARDAGLPVI